MAPELAKLPQPKTLTLHDWTPERGQNAKIIEYLAAIQSRLIAQGAKNGRGPKVRPEPRPETAVDRYEREALKAQHRDLTAQLIPHKR